MAWVRGLMALQLIGLIVSSMCINGEGNKLISPHAPPPAPLPVKTPPPPVKAPPPPPPTKAPPLSPIKLSAAVEGVVYCMSCKLPGYQSSSNASPLNGAVATVLCGTPRQVLSYGNATTDTHGYFYIQVKNKRPSTVGTCKVQLKLPAWCDKPVYPKGVLAGAVPIKFEKISRVGSSKLVLFNTGFLEFAPARPGLCPRQA